MRYEKMDTPIVYQARLHWILFFWPMALIALMEYVGYRVEWIRTPSIIMALVGVVWAMILLMTYQFSSLTIKKNQIILRSGLLVRQTVDIPLSKIESIDIRQSILGSVLRYGTLTITGTGGTRQFLAYLSRPLTCRRYIEQLLQTKVDAS